MNFRHRIAGAINILAGKQVNFLGSGNTNIGQQFLRWGNRTPDLMPDWSQVRMTPRDKYTGYVYAAIRNRANKVAQVATENLRTDASPALIDKAKKSETEVVHPYLTLIDSSKTFSNYRFWYEIGAFIDLKGCYFLMAVRNVRQQQDGLPLVGKVASFELINPFEITRVRDQEHLEIQGYIQNRRGFTRDIPKEMIIEIDEFNPFDDDDPYSLAEAAADPQYTLKQADDYTRHSIRNNINSPGIISTDVILTPEQLTNFKARMMGQEKGQPIFSDGAGGVKWNPMQIDLDKAALATITDMNLSKLLAITGMSKTTFGIEQSGVTRDTSEVQSNQLIANHAIPRLQLVIDALNQDYKTHYAKDYDQSKYRVWIDSPLGTDKEAESKDVKIRDDMYNLYSSLVDAGYDVGLAARYSAGEITLEELGEPTNDPKPKELPPTPTRVSETEPTPGSDPVLPDTKAKKAEPKKPAEKNAIQRNRLDVPDGYVRCRCCDGYGEHDTGAECYRCDASGSVTPDEDKQPVPCDGAAEPAEQAHRSRRHVPAVHNSLDESTTAVLKTQEASLKNAIINIEQQLVGAIITRVATNAYEEAGDLINAEAWRIFEQELAMVLGAFYGGVVPLFAQSVLVRRAQELGLFGQFSLDQETKDYITKMADQAALSHINTVLGDVLDAIHTAQLVNLNPARILPVVMKKYPAASEAEVLEVIKKAVEASKDQRGVAEAIRRTYGNAAFEDLLAAVRQAALEGASQDQLIRAIRQSYVGISKTRAELVARTETNRAFTTAQYQADRQFLEQNNLTGRAYKQWVTRSGNPCPFCLALSKEPPVPFRLAFAEIGDVLTATVENEDGSTTVKKMPITYENLEAGNGHPNCLCIYRLIVE